MAQVRRGGQVQSKLQFLIYGKKGTRKSSMALEFSKMKNEKDKPMQVLYIDAEKNSVDDYLENLAEQGIDIDNILLLKTREFKETLEIIINAGKANEKVPFEVLSENEDGTKSREKILNADGSNFIPDVIVIDSISTLHDQLITSMTNLSQRRAGIRANKAGIMGDEKTIAVETAGMEIKDYNQVKEKQKELIQALLSSAKHFVLIAREDVKKIQDKDADNKFQMIETGETLPKGFKEIGYDVKTVLHTVNEDGIIYAYVEDKDRTGVKKQGEKIESPTLLDWEVVINKNKGKKPEVIINNLKESVEKDIEAIQEDIIVQTGEDVISKSDYNKKLNSLQKEIPDLIKKVVDTKHRGLLKQECDKRNFPLQVKSTKVEDIETLEKMKDFIKEFLTENNIH